MMTISHVQGRAMAQGVKEANERAHEAEPTDYDTEEIIRNLQSLLQLRNREIAELKLENDTLKRSGSHVVSGRAEITPEAAAEALRVSVSSVNRALNGKLKTRHLEGRQEANGHWRVYSDSLSGYRSSRKSRS